MRYKNHEGYADPTAGEAVMRASRKKKKVLPEWGHLTFRLGDLEYFKLCIGRMLL